MRLLHTSDWHLGRSLHGTDLIDAQATALDQLVEVVKQEQIDAVLVAGDVYDRSVPPVRAVELLDDVVCRLAEQTSVVIIPGNHDSSTRLGFGSRVFGDRIRVRSSLDRLAEPVELADEHGVVLVYAVPFLYPDIVRHQLVEPGADPLPRTHQHCMAAAINAIRKDRQARGGARHSLVMAHAFVTGAASHPIESESERDISVGGVDRVDAAIFDGFPYVALGHLHGPQETLSRDRDTTIRYSGSPLRYSFSEADQHKSFTIVDLGAQGIERISAVEIPQPRPMARISDSMTALLGSPTYDEHTQAWVQVSVTDPARPVGLYEQVSQRFPHALVVRHEPESGPLTHHDDLVISATDPLALTRQFVEYVTGGKPTSHELAAFQDAYETARDHRRDT